MMHRDRIIVDEDSPEAGGEVAEITTGIMQRMITENVGVVVGTGHFERDCPSRNQGGRR